ncbi:hypothetical protein Hypma_010445 [Hypsizygus marmoreus]|uniref:Uncharacterized protein n=1 Tax=Hypsizygus marmoreus TaxID=39966 RepID=A0A369KEK5_HYPMA|nr:hypothetical protein Hypma_010445 [Hypsizygus marmoreus]
MPLLPTNTPTTTKSKRTFRAQYLVPLLFLIPILCAVMGAFMGAFIDRALTSDIADPRVRDRIRRDWEIEEKQQHRQMEAARSREKKERWERQTRHLYWDNVKGFRCEGYGLRIYTGYLANLSPSMDVIAACKAIPVTINGITYDSPLYCEDRGRFRGVYGSWLIKDDVICTTYWQSFENMGCTAPGSGYRRIEAPLTGLRFRDDSEKMCITTPVTIYGQHFDHPMACPEGFFGGRRGIWDVPDDNCR